ncbi:MAG TPA: histidine kinase [Marinobacter sp.]|nr:histidine kinase [Marinobacter sp.]
MVLIVFLLAYLLRRRLDALDTFSGDKLWQQWFHRAATVEAGQEARTRTGLALIILPALGVGSGVYLLESMGWRIAGYPLECLILVLLMGMPGWRQPLLAYINAWQRGDMQAAWHHVQNKLPIESRGTALSPEIMHLSLLRTLMLTVFQRFFLIGFWYVAGGIGFAILARGLVALSAQWPQAAARPRYLQLLEWMARVPAWLLSLTFGVAGDLAGWLHDMRLMRRKIRKKTEEILMISAKGSLTGYALDPERFSSIHPDEWTDFGGRSLNAVRDLLNRSMLVWICVLALLVISGLA